MFFHGMIGIATADFLGQESELLDIRPVLDKIPSYHVLPLEAVAAWSPFARGMEPL